MATAQRKALPTFRTVKERREAYNRDVLQKEDWGYTYPEEMDLRPGSELTRIIIEDMHECIHECRSVTQNMEPQWSEMDKTLGLYMPADEWDQEQKDIDPRRPITIVTPMTFQNKELYQSFFYSNLLKRREIQKYRGLGSREALVAGAKMELLNAVQSGWFKERTIVDMAIGQSVSYGRSFVAAKWTRQTRRRPTTVQASNILAFELSRRGQPVLPGENVRYQDDMVTKEGTELFNLDIRKVFYDPHVSSNNLQDGEYVGWVYNTNAPALINREADPEQGIFNCRYVQNAAKHRQATSVWMDDKKRNFSPDGEITPEDASSNEQTSPVDVIVFCRHLIPAAYGINSETKPEKWIFEVAADDIIIRADRLEDDHCCYPVLDMALNADGVLPNPIGHLMLIQGSQRLSDWLWKTKQDAVRTILNGLIFFDPAKVDPDDMMNPGMGKYVRVRNGSYNDGGVGNYVHQMQITDPTEQHPITAAQIMAMAQEGIGTGEVSRGDLSNVPDRPTKMGIQAATSGGFARMGLLAHRIDEQFLVPLAEIKAYNTRQYLGGEVFIPVAGRYEELLRAEYGLQPNMDLAVYPEELDFALEVETLLSDIGGMQDLTGMGEILKTSMTNPIVQMTVGQMLDWEKVFLSYFRKIGFDDIHEFRRMAPQGMGVNVVPMQDQQVQQMAQSGQLVPIAA